MIAQREEFRWTLFYERVIQQLSFSEAIQVMKRCFAELQKEKFRKVSAM